MASVHTKVKKYLETNSKTDAELYNGNIVLADDGDGVVYIRTWNVDGVTKPTDSQIASYETTGNQEEALNTVLAKRKKEYLSWNEQLDKLYHDINDGKFGDAAKTSTWYTHIKSVKDDNSKS